MHGQNHIKFKQYHVICVKSAAVLGPLYRLKLDERS